MFRFLRPMEKLVLVTCECDLGSPTARRERHLAVGWRTSGAWYRPGEQERRKPVSNKMEAKAQGCPDFHMTAMTDVPAVTHMSACTHAIH